MARSKLIQTVVTPEEYEVVAARARARGLTISEYVRDRVLYDLDINLPTGLRRQTKEED